MLDCERSFYQSENKRKQLRSSYVASILVTKLTFAMFLLKLSTLSATIFLFVSLFFRFYAGGQQEFSLFFLFQYSLSDVDIRH